MKKLNKLVDCSYDIEIAGVKSDSRDVHPGDLFVAVKGFFVDHSEYIEDAIKNGAVAVVTEKEAVYSVPSIQVKNVNQEFLKICAKFFDKEDWNFSLIGVTGTDGKTTTAMMIQQLLDENQCGYIGTNGVWYQNKHYKTNNTTPLTEYLYEHLQNMQKNDCSYVSLEVASEALLHGRVDDLKFRYAILTNISEDHLNIHKTKENYIASKIKLFSLIEENGYAILNADDSHYQEVKSKTNAKICTYGTSKDASFQIQNVSFSKDGTSFDLVHQDDTFHIESPYLGLYNAYNLTAAFIVCYLEKMNPADILSAIKNLKTVPGRCEFLDFGQNFQILLDYAHTTNGLEKILELANDLKPKRIITVVGSAGGREKEKRASMGKIILEKSDFVIFTMDDPRYEKVEDIIDDLIGDSKKKNYIKIIDRKDAINKALSMAEEGDLVAILGKGRDTYMAVEDKKLEYCDYDVIDNYFKNLF